MTNTKDTHKMSVVNEFIKDYEETFSNKSIGEINKLSTQIINDFVVKWKGFLNTNGVYSSRCLSRPKYLLESKVGVVSIIGNLYRMKLAKFKFLADLKTQNMSFEDYVLQKK